MELYVLVLTVALSLSLPSLVIIIGLMYVTYHPNHL